MTRDTRVGTLVFVDPVAPISGIRLSHVDQPDRGVRVNREESSGGPIAWREVMKVGKLEQREGKGESGLLYRVRRGDAWRVSVFGSRREIEVGSARLRDHAMELARMWEQSVLSGHIDMS